MHARVHVCVGGCGCGCVLLTIKVTTLAPHDEGSPTLEVRTDQAQGWPKSKRNLVTQEKDGLRTGEADLGNRGNGAGPE